MPIANWSGQQFNVHQPTGYSERHAEYKGIDQIIYRQHVYIQKFNTPDEMEIICGRGESSKHSMKKSLRF